MSKIKIKMEMKTNLKNKTGGTEPNATIIKSIYRGEIVWKLYKKCSEAKKRDEIISIKICLQPVDFPVSIEYPKKVLNDLKSQCAISGYKLEVEENKLPPTTIEETIGSNVDLLSFASHEDIENMPKRYSTIDNSAYDYVAIVTCNPGKLTNCLKNEFREAKEKGERALKRKEVECLFKKERVLKCDDLRFSISSGNVLYKDLVVNFEPESKSYKVLRDLLEHPNSKRNVQQLGLLMSKRSYNVASPKNIKDIINTIRKKLKMYGGNALYENIFVVHRGGRIKCKKTE